jgi:hypothetical protein
MRFTVPQFIERESRIVGPLTFRQFVFVGTAGAICAILYFTVSVSVFLIACLFLVGGAVALAFLTVEGRRLDVLLKHFFYFTLKPKIYIWKRIEMPIRILREKSGKTEEEKEELPLKIAEKSQLKKLRNLLEIRPD